MSDLVLSAEKVTELASAYDMFHELEDNDLVVSIDEADGGPVFDGDHFARHDSWVTFQDGTQLVMTAEYGPDDEPAEEGP